MDGEADFTPVYQSADGLEVRLDAASRRDSRGIAYTHHRLVTAGGRPGAVIVATHAQRVLLVQVDRDPAGPRTWELPRGSGEREDARPDAAAESAAAQTGMRELREETGLHLASAEVIGSYVIDSAVYPQVVFVVRCAVDDPRPAHDGDGEVDALRWVDADELSALVRDGVLADAHSLAALAVLWASEAGP